MSNLELKHLAAYLPYGLKIEGQTHYEIIEMTGLNSGTVIVNHDTRGWADFYDIKPILRPLFEFDDSDDLRKVHEFIGLGKWCEVYDFYFKAWFDDIANVNKLVLQAPYEIFQYFLANHFDVFELIPAGLAIDINKLKYEH